MKIIQPFTRLKSLIYTISFPGFIVRSTAAVFNQVFLAPIIIYDPQEYLPIIGFEFLSSQRVVLPAVSSISHTSKGKLSYQLIFFSS